MVGFFGDADGVARLAREDAGFEICLCQLLGLGFFEVSGTLLSCWWRSASDWALSLARVWQTGIPAMGKCQGNVGEELILVSCLISLCLIWPS